MIRNCLRLRNFSWTILFRSIPCNKKSFGNLRLEFNFLLALLSETNIPFRSFQGPHGKTYLAMQFHKFGFVTASRCRIQNRKPFSPLKRGHFKRKGLSSRSPNWAKTQPTRFATGNFVEDLGCAGTPNQDIGSVVQIRVV